MWLKVTFFFERCGGEPVRGHLAGKNLLNNFDGVPIKHIIEDSLSIRPSMGLLISGCFRDNSPVTGQTGRKFSRSATTSKFKPCAPSPDCYQASDCILGDNNASGFFFDISQHVTLDTICKNILPRLNNHFFGGRSNNFYFRGNM